MIKALITILVCLSASNAMAFKFESSVPPEVQAKLLADLNFMYGIQSSATTPFHQEIYGPSAGASYQKFFEGRIDYIGLDDCGSPEAVACVMPFPNPNYMSITQNFVTGDHPQIARMLVIFHEARHAEYTNNHWNHDTCPTPFLDPNGKEVVSIWTGAPLAGKPGCDSTYLGSYGSSTILIKNIAKFCTNCSDKTKLDAEIYAEDQLNRIDRPDVRDAMTKDFAYDGR
jgi:hypothetical protein